MLHPYTEELLDTIAAKLGGKIEPKMEILAVDIRGGPDHWRLIVWAKFEEDIHTYVIHQASIVEVYPDAPVPPKEQP